jgi:endoglucanase
MVVTATRRRILIGAIAAGVSQSAVAGPSSERDGVISTGLRRGFNLPDRAPLHSDQNLNIETLKSLRRFGMTHVRAQVVAEHVLPRFSGPAMISRTMDDLSALIELLLRHDYHVSVDMHPEGEFQALQRRDPRQAHEALLVGWGLLAARLAHWPADRINAELLNEPATSDDIWRPFSETLAQAVRADLRHNSIIVGPAPYQRGEALTNWHPFSDRNIVYAFHYYDPMAFTHQGAFWAKGSTWARMEGLPFPIAPGDHRVLELANNAQSKGDADVARDLWDIAKFGATPESILAKFSEVADWSRVHAAPVIVNEFGALRWKTRPVDRMAWIAAVRRAAEATGIGWAHWDYVTAFGLLHEDGTLDFDMMRALFGA